MWNCNNQVCLRDLLQKRKKKKMSIIGHTESYQVTLSKNVIHAQVPNHPKVNKSTFLAKAQLWHRIINVTLMINSINVFKHKVLNILTKCYKTEIN